MSTVMNAKKTGTFKFRAKIVDLYPRAMHEWVVAYCDLCEGGKE
jgi:hypothetical protein